MKEKRTLNRREVKGRVQRTQFSGGVWGEAPNNPHKYELTFLLFHISALDFVHAVLYNNRDRPENQGAKKKNERMRQESRFGGVFS